MIAHGSARAAGDPFADRVACAAADKINPNNQSGVNRDDAQRIVGRCDTWVGILKTIVSEIDARPLALNQRLVWTLGYRDLKAPAYGKAAVFQALTLETANAIFFESEAERALSRARALRLLDVASAMLGYARKGPDMHYQLMALDAQRAIQSDKGSW